MKNLGVLFLPLFLGVLHSTHIFPQHQGKPFMIRPKKKKNAPGPVGWDNPQDIRKIAPP